MYYGQRKLYKCTNTFVQKNKMNGVSFRAFLSLLYNLPQPASQPDFGEKVTVCKCVFLSLSHKLIFLGLWIISKGNYVCSPHSRTYILCKRILNNSLLPLFASPPTTESEPIFKGKWKNWAGDKFEVSEHLYARACPFPQPQQRV